jgi:hypothetical protein
MKDLILLKTDRLRGVEIDVERRIARVRSGSKWGDVLPRASDLGLAAHPRPELGTEADEELGHLDPERSRHGEVRGLVDHDHEDQSDDEGTDAESGHSDTS